MELMMLGASISRRLTDRASAAGATVLGAPHGCLLHRPLLGAQTERCRGARHLQAQVRPRASPLVRRTERITESLPCRVEDGNGGGSFPCLDAHATIVRSAPKGLHDTDAIGAGK